MSLYWRRFLLIAVRGFKICILEVSLPNVWARQSTYLSIVARNSAGAIPCLHFGMKTYPSRRSVAMSVLDSIGESIPNLDIAHTPRLSNQQRTSGFCATCPRVHAIPTTCSGRRLCDATQRYVATGVLRKRDARDGTIDVSHAGDKKPRFCLDAEARAPRTDPFVRTCRPLRDTLFRWYAPRPRLFVSPRSTLDRITIHLSMAQTHAKQCFPKQIDYHRLAPLSRHEFPVPGAFVRRDGAMPTLDRALRSLPQECSDRDRRLRLARHGDAVSVLELLPRRTELPH